MSDIVGPAAGIDEQAAVSSAFETIQIVVRFLTIAHGPLMGMYTEGLRIGLRMLVLFSHTVVNWQQKLAPQSD